MLFTWDTTNLCIVFRSWRITSTLTLILSLLGVIALTAGYEAVREASRQYEQRLAAKMESAPRKYLPNQPATASWLMGTSGTKLTLAGREYGAGGRAEGEGG